MEGSEGRTKADIDALRDVRLKSRMLELRRDALEKEVMARGSAADRFCARLLEYPELCRRVCRAGFFSRVRRIFSAAFSNQICSKTTEVAKWDVDGRTVKVVAGKMGLGICPESRSRELRTDDELLMLLSISDDVVSGLMRVGTRHARRKAEEFRVFAAIVKAVVKSKSSQHAVEVPEDVKLLPFDLPSAVVWVGQDTEVMMGRVSVDSAYRSSSEPLTLYLSCDGVVRREMVRTYDPSGILALEQLIPQEAFLVGEFRKVLEPRFAPLLDCVVKLEEAFQPYLIAEAL